MALKHVLLDTTTGKQRASGVAVLPTKAGIVASGSFSGTPKKAAVAFSASFADNNYAVTVTGEDSRSWTIESKSASGFTINANTGTALTGNTFWTAIKNGETG